MSKHAWAVILALVGIAAAYVLFFRKSDEDRIRGKLAALSETVGKDAGEDLVRRAARIERAFPHLFTKEVDLHIPDVAEGRQTRPALVALAAGAAGSAGRIDLHFSRVHVEIERPERRAWVTADAELLGTDRDGDAYRESRPLTLRFDMEEDEWKIADVAAP